MKTLKDLLIAMVNATLILVALCLFLLWQLAGKTENIAANFASNLKVVQPVGEEVRGLREDVAGLRADISKLGTGTDQSPTSTRQALDIRLAALNAKLDRIQTTMTKLAETPDRLMTQAIDRSTTQLAQTAYALRGCTAPPTPVGAATPSN
ncbi:hypothetical protein [Shimia sp.]|uniref:hypothetical protein n=1 Tax=Shimia sp. TaxID=1954381 RepID=UPI0032981B58